MGRLTTHVLDTMHGRPAAGVVVRLLKGGVVVTETVTDADGRCDQSLLSGETMRTGAYRLEFGVGDYFRGLGVVAAEPTFLDLVPIEFGIADADAHYHVPLLVSPYAYSTYRGS